MMKILIIKPSSLGDVIHSLPFLRAIKDTFQDAHIEWVISKSLKGILERNPLIDKLIVFDKDSWKKLRNFPKTAKGVVGLVKTLRAGRYNMVVDLQGLLRTGVMAFFAPSPLKIGFKHAREGSRHFYNKKISVNGSLHAVDKCLEVAKSVGAKTNRVEFPLYIDDTERRIIRSLIGNLTEYVVVVPSARWETKRWPPRNFGTLIAKLPVPCVITGTNADKQTVQQVMAFSGEKGINLCGKTGLKELTALIAESKAVVSNDSGPMHIGAALGIPVIALFGPTDPSKTGPYGWSEICTEQKSEKLKVLRASLDCSPCFRKKCKDPLCMRNISVETVFKEIKEYL